MDAIFNKPKPKSRSCAGFTLIELVIVILVFGILSAVAMPYMKNIIESSERRNVTRGIASTLRKARSMAASENREFKVKFEIAAKRYGLYRGNRASASTTWEGPLGEYSTIPPQLGFAKTLTCDDSADGEIQFNPNGSANMLYVCVIKDGDLNNAFRVGVQSSSTGKVVIK